MRASGSDAHPQVFLVRIFRLGTGRANSHAVTGLRPIRLAGPATGPSCRTPPSPAASAADTANALSLSTGLRLAEWAGFPPASPVLFASAAPEPGLVAVSVAADCLRAVSGARALEGVEPVFPGTRLNLPVESPSGHRQGQPALSHTQALFHGSGREGRWRSFRVSIFSLDKTSCNLLNIHY